MLIVKTLELRLFLGGMAINRKLLAMNEKEDYLQAYEILKKILGGNSSQELDGSKEKEESMSSEI